MASVTDTPLLRVENAVVRRQGRRVLGPLSLTVRSGEFWGVVGPNGAGKSTLLAIAAGRLLPESGELDILGCGDMNRLLKRKIRREIGVLLQSHDFSEDLPLSVEEIVLFGRVSRSRPMRRYSREDRAAAREALEAFGLSHLQRRRYCELSGGERQKVQLARLLAQQSRLLLLDEPTSGLDLDWQERLTHQVASLHEKYGRTVLMVTHDIDHLPTCCNRVLLLKAGRAVAAGKPEDVFKASQLSQLYGCQMEVTRRRGRFHAWSQGLETGEEIPDA